MDSLWSAEVAELMDEDGKERFIRGKTMAGLMMEAAGGDVTRAIRYVQVERREFL